MTNHELIYFHLIKASTIIYKLQLVQQKKIARLVTWIFKKVVVVVVIIDVDVFVFFKLLLAASICFRTWKTQQQQLKIICVVVVVEVVS